MGDTQSAPIQRAEPGATVPGMAFVNSDVESRMMSSSSPSQQRDVGGGSVHAGPGSSGGVPPGAAAGSYLRRNASETTQPPRQVLPARLQLEEDDVTKITGEKPEHDMMCSVCLELLWKPVIFECGHVFCFWCGFQCMNAYDVSRCPLCKNAFDKFPRVCRPLNLFLLRRFPRTTTLRDRDMAEFEFSRRRQSPCHMRICDTSSGASTDAVGRCSRQILLLVREKAPDIAALMQYPDKARGSSDSSGKDECGSTSSRKVDTDEAKDDSVGSPDDCTMDDIDEGDTSIRPVDLRAVVTGHVRNRGDDPVPAMDSDDEDSPVPQRGPFHTSASSSALSTLPGHEEATGDFALAGSREEQTTTRDSDFGEGGDGLTHHPLFNENLLTMDEFVHYGVSCDGCGKMPIVGRRHTCVDCGKASCDFDLCGACQDAGYSRPGRFNQNHSADHEVRLVEQSAAEWWIQSLNRMRKIHPELSVHQILQWILMHYQDVWVADNQQGEETAMESGTDIAGNDAVAA